LKVAFTICSNNYLSQAIVLGQSLRQTNPDYKFHIGIVDTKSEYIDYGAYPDFNFIFIDKIGLVPLNSLIERYNIIELNTSVKASYFKYLFHQHPTCTHIHYFDPDIKVFQKLKHLDSLFDNHHILLTPHIFHPIPDDNLEPRENMFLNYGIYNLGYIGLKNHPESFKLLEWWNNHTLQLGYMDVKNGYFVDQLWMNHVPIFFNGVSIVKEKGFNCAPWNIQERKIIEVQKDGILLDDKSFLTFYHFSSFNPNHPNILSSAYSRNTFEKHPLFKEIYDIYSAELLSAKYNQYRQIKCGLYPIDEVIIKETNSMKGLKNIIRLLIPPILIELAQRIRN
jgi:hypothetical protein